MSITLKNITAADTISSMVDKINFNFDQLLLNGGGIEGPRGVEGYPGMQGAQGAQGSTGAQGAQGERGIHFHILPLNGTDYCVESCITDGLGEIDPFGDSWLDGDMIIAYRSESNDGNYNYTDSIWRVVYKDGQSGEDFYPESAIQEPSSSSTKTLWFSMTTFFNEFGVNGTSNKLLRTKLEDYKRGFVLNDYNENLNENNINAELIDDIVNNNIALVYTEPVGSNSNNESEGSPNCGIVFYKSINISENPEIGNFPRINYVYSPDGTINYLNIYAKEQGLQLHAKNNILIKSEIGNLTLDVTAEDGIFELKRDGSNFITLRKQNSYNELHLVSDEIFFENTENVVADRWIKIRNKDYSDTTSCEIILCKQNTYVQTNESSIFSIGKTGLEFKPSVSSNPTAEEQAAIEAYYNQSRIIISNDETNSYTNIISPVINAGREPLDDTAADNYGLYLSKEKIQILATKSYDSLLTSYDKSEIKLEAETPHESNVIIDTTYPGVTKFSNSSERYLNCIINYPDSTMTENNYDRYHNIKFCTSPMSDNILKNGRYNYANCNCYYNMAVRNVKNMGSVHGGTIQFVGKYESSYTGTMYDKMTYTFVRIGSTVHCNVHGVINTNKISARKNYAVNIAINDLQNFGETYCKSTDQAVVNWPVTTSLSQKYPSYASPATRMWAGGGLDANSLLNNLDYSKQSSDTKLIISSALQVSLNKLYLNLFPPVVRISYDSSTGKYNANIKDFSGHLTYSSGGSIYEKELYYGNGELISKTIGNNTAYKIPAIIVRNMYNSLITKSMNISDPTGTVVGNSGFVLNGSTSENLVEVNAYFSYSLTTEQDDIHQYSDDPIDLGSTVIGGLNTNSAVYSYTPTTPSAEQIDESFDTGIENINIDIH